MNDPTDTTAILQLIGQIDALAAPSVAPVQSVIRSGDQFLLNGQTQQLPGRTPTPAPGPVPTPGPTAVPSYLGSLVIEWGYDVEYAHVAQFQRWLIDNEAELRAEAPQHCHYWGTYAVFSQTDLSAGAYRTLWAYDSLAAMTVMNDTLANPGLRFAVLLKEMMSFRDRRIGAGRSQQIYHPAALARPI